MEISLKALHSRDFGFVFLFPSPVILTEVVSGCIQSTVKHPPSLSLNCISCRSDRKHKAVEKIHGVRWRFNTESKSCVYEQTDKLTCYFPLVGSYLATSQKAQPMVASEDKHYNYKYPLFLLLSLIFYCWAHCHVVWDIASVDLDQLSQLCALPTFCSLLAYSLGVGREERMSCHCAISVQ